MTTVILATLPLIGVAVGAVLQHWFSRKAEDRKQLQGLRCEAYVEYLRAVVQVGFAKTPESEIAGRAALALAKARIAVYGTPATVAALAAFERTDVNLAHQGARDSFVELARCMRESDTVSPTDLRLILLGTEPAGALPNKPLQQSGSPQ